MHSIFRKINNCICLKMKDEGFFFFLVRIIGTFVVNFKITFQVDNPSSNFGLWQLAELFVCIKIQFLDVKKKEKNIEIVYNKEYMIEKAES